MKHLDLFSGIGGFALAAQWVWGSDYQNVGFCEIDPFCQAVLRKHWPDATIYGDIKTLTDAGEDVDLLTGGFPCQPFSAAGRRRGTQDDRHLWPQMLRVIREVRPRWIIAENVRGLIASERGLVLEQVFADLEAACYDVQAFVIPAVAVGAPHRRDRIWIVAHSKGRRSWQQTQREGREDPKRRSWETPWPVVAAELCRVDDGISSGLDETRRVSAEPRKNKTPAGRTHRLKALGNAIVPQVATEIMKAIQTADTR